MRPLTIGVSLLALMASTAYAQQPPKPAAPQPGAATTAQTETRMAVPISGSVDKLQAPSVQTAVLFIGTH